MYKKISKQALYFVPYGFLEPLTKEEYFKGPWKYVCSHEAEDGGVYDVVRNRLTDEYRFTEV